MIHLPVLADYTRQYADLPFEPLTVTARLKPGSRLISYNPVYLDNLLARAVVDRATQGSLVADLQDDGYWLPVPLAMAWQSERGFPLWQASVFMPVDEPIRDTFYQHKRASQGLKLSNPTNLRTTAGRWMDRRIPYPMAVCDTWKARCIGNAAAIEELLSTITLLGKRRAIGMAEVAEWLIEPASFDSALVIDSALAHAVPAEAWSVLPIIPDTARVLVGWTPPQWKPCLWLDGWQVGTPALRTDPDFFRDAP